MDIQQLSFEETNRFSKLICDYLSAKEELKPFYGAFPELNNFASQIELKKKKFSAEHRAVLVKSLRDQYKVLEPSAAVSKNLDLLALDNTFTITTGHQLCLMTGPLYFIYKIITCINLAEKAAAANPVNKIVPVFWMASEDHDFEEINHASIAGTKFEWKAESGGAVGELATSGIDQIIDSIDHYLGNQVGKGSGKDAATIFGAIIGAKAAENGKKTIIGYKQIEQCEITYIRRLVPMVVGYSTTVSIGLGDGFDDFTPTFRTDRQYSVGSTVPVRMSLSLN